MGDAAVCVGRCDLVANKWPLPTGGIVAEPDFHLIGDSMADKFRNVKHTGVIIFGGIWMERVAGIRTGSGISDVQYIREWGEVGWGRVTRGWLAWGASGMLEVCPDFGWCVDYGRLEWLIGNFAGAGGRGSLRPGFRLSPE